MGRNVSLNNILRYAGIWLALIIVFGGAYKSPLGNISTAHIIVIWAALLLACYLTTPSREWAKLYILNTRKYRLYFYVMFLMFIVSAFNYLIMNVGDEFFFGLQIKRLVLAFISFLLFPIILNALLYRLTPKQIFFSVLTFMLFLVVFSLLQLGSSDFRMWFLERTAIDGYWLEWAKQSNRAIGLKAMSIWDTSVAYSIFIFICFGVVKTNKKNISNLSIYVFIAITFLLVGLSGRTGLLFLCSFVFLLCVLYEKKSLLLFFALTLFLMILMIITLSGSEVIIRVVDFALELFVNVINGNFHTNSTDDLINNHLFIPNINNIAFGENTFIGDGEEVQSEISRSSDSSFVINFVAYGMFGVVCTTLLMLINTRVFFDFFMLTKKNKFYYVTLLVCFLLCFGLYIKALVYISATLLKAMIFVSVVINRFKSFNDSNNNKVDYR
ncbi:hypothetical protein FVB43_06930 [Erwinia rhapontici]|uniref:hypothetical protein n=1 Tax=Erwinia rhapontici TaxID=55212 RepID=UPI0014382C51|nr:hypothetical protein [Erwinia rhapontici]NKG29775.1 hypothetical protein [Erwinia rhapontici]